MATAPAHAQTLRQMEREGPVIPAAHSVVPPKVEYRLTDFDAQ